MWLVWIPSTFACAIGIYILFVWLQQKTNHEFSSQCWTIPETHFCFSYCKKSPGNTIFHVSCYDFFCYLWLVVSRTHHIPLSKAQVWQIHLIADCKYSIFLNHLFQSYKITSIAVTSTSERLMHKIFLLPRILKLTSRWKIFLWWKV